MFRTVNDQPTLWDSILPPELLVLPLELSRVDALLDDPAFFAPFVAYFDARIGRPSIPMETYLRLMFLKFRYRLGYESLCREVADSISGQRFCRIPFGTRVPHPTTLMKLTTRCGTTAVDGCNEALLAKAVEAKLLRTTRLRADTTVVPADVAYPTDSGLLAKAVRRSATTARRVQAAGGATASGSGTAAAPPVPGPAKLGRSCGCARHRAERRPRPPSGGSPGNWPTSPNAPLPRRRSCWSTPAEHCTAPNVVRRKERLRESGSACTTPTPARLPRTTPFGIRHQRHRPSSGRSS